ncbi:MAG: hypothetical protein HY064_00010 [Bacteroidetes bacterium]|nr:hypothetical protein [Bacteroidota bacterium]
MKKIFFSHFLLPAAFFSCQNNETTHESSSFDSAKKNEPVMVVDETAHDYFNRIYGILQNNDSLHWKDQFSPAMQSHFPDNKDVMKNFDFYKDFFTKMVKNDFKGDPSLVNISITKNGMIAIVDTLQGTDSMKLKVVRVNGKILMDEK